MIEVIKLDSIGKLIDFSTENPLKAHPIMNYTYRGLSKAHYKLTSSLKRIAGPNIKYVEKRSLMNFRKYGTNFNPNICNSIWESMIIAQHHGLPTRLLDFSISPLVALYFALTDIHSEDDAAVWAISHVRLHDLLPTNYRLILEKNMARSFTVDILNEMDINIDKYNSDMNNKSLLFIEPPAIDQRITYQFSHFALLPNSLDPLDDFLEKCTIPRVAYKYIIPSEKKELFKKQLDTMNITKRTLFPGLDGIASYLLNRYQDNF